MRAGVIGPLRFDRRLPLRLARLHLATPVGAVVELRVTARPAPAPGLRDLVVGAGFEPGPGFDDIAGGAVVRRLSLPDTVGPRMRVLVCGLNPSVYAAERGVGFARPGNRFWPAARAAGLVGVERDPLRALTVDRVGMTDLCKRATTASSALRPDEYAAGAARVERLVRWLGPSVVAFVGLEGWRAAVDPSANEGLQARRFGGRPAYVLGSTSGLNAHARLADVVGHLRRVVDLAGGSRVTGPGR